jgi:tetratricopeptide (TPR) repeat protein
MSSKKAYMPVSFISLKIKIIIIIFIICRINNSPAQKTVDSLRHVLSKQNEDTLKVKTLVNMLSVFSRSDLDSAILYAGKGLDLVKRLQQNCSSQEKIFFQKNEAYINYVCANCYISKGDYPIALNLLDQCAGLYSQLKEPKRLAYALSCKGVIFKNTGDYPKAIDVYMKALELSESVDDKYGCASILGNIGSVYVVQKKNAEALIYYKKSLQLAEVIKNDLLILGGLSNIGICYYNNAILFKNAGKTSEADQQFKLAANYFYKTVSIREKSGDKAGLVISYTNLGELLKDMGDYSKAMVYQLKSLKISEEMDDKQAIARSLINIGMVLHSKKNYKEAIHYLEKGLALSESIGEKDFSKEAYKGLSDVYASAGDYRMAYDYYRKYTVKKDSLLNEETVKQIAESESKYKSEKKDKEILLLNKDKEIQNTELEKQKTVRNSFIGGFILMLALAFIILRSYLQNKRANKQLLEKNKVIENQKKIVEEKQKEILDSIYYARRIQNSLLPRENYFQKQFDRR